MTIIYWTLSWLAGILVASVFDFSTPFWLLAGALALISAIVARRHITFTKASLFLATLAIGGAHYTLALPETDPGHVSTFNGRNNILLTGLIKQEPRQHDNSLELVLASATVQTGDEQLFTHGDILLQANPYPSIPYGAFVRVSGNLETPQNFDDFDYRQFLARKNIFSIMEKPKVEILRINQGNPLYHILLKIKDRNQNIINHLLPEPQSGLLSGILLGNDQGISGDLADDFRATGMTHIIAISGFNIVIVAGLLLLTGRYLFSFRTAAWIAILGISIYAIFVGADSSVVRAAIMAGLLILATQIMGRPIFYPSIIFTAALFMTLINPHILWDVGFQLSFAATLGLALYVGPWNRKIKSRIDPILGESAAPHAMRLITEVILATMAAMIMTFPIILYHFGTLSIISPLANFFILPAQPGVMTWGGLAMLLGNIHPIFGQIPAWIAWLFLTYTIGLVRFFANLPITALPVSIPLAGVVLIYGFILAFTWLSAQEKDVRDRLLGQTRQARLTRAGFSAIAIATILAIFWLNQRPDGHLHVVFLDVGQGDATFIQTPSGRQVLVDGGPNGGILLDGLGAEMPFWDKDIDMLVATHSDKDHFVGFIDLLARHNVGTLITNGQAGDSPEYDTLIAAAEGSAIPIHHGLAGQIIELEDSVRLEILHPAGEFDSEDNNNSVSMRLVYHDFTLLLTGDAESEAEQAMMASGRPLQSLIYKAGHHGANTSSSAIFLESVRPQFVIISAGLENRYGHPHPEMVERAEAVGAAVMRTDEMGTIEVISDGQQIWWDTE